MSHDSCKRQSLKDEARKHLLCKRYMDEYIFFSIAVDTALFRYEHFISCMVRFSFDNRVLELPLFIGPCFVSSGKDLAGFIFRKLEERNARFDKFVSMATDGAANMIGKYNGVTSHFKVLVREHCRDNNVACPLSHSVWCFAHRLNLVTKSFLTAKPVNIVVAFADWFANKRRQVSYKSFLTSNHSGSQVRAIPQPSLTRWMFYKDVVSAIVSQAPFVEEFVSDESDFITFWNQLRNDPVNYGPWVEQEFSFKNKRIKAIFDFTQFFLELVGRTNSVFQERFSTVGQLWEIVVSLKMKVNSLIIQMGREVITSLESLCELSREETGQLQTTLRQLLHSLEMRFPVPSVSFDMKLRQHSRGSGVSLLNPPTTLEHLNCSVLPLLSFMAFPHDVVHFDLSPSVLQRGLHDEVERMTQEILTRKNAIIKVNRERSRAVSKTVGFPVVTPIGVADVFTVLDSRDYPLIWREYIKSNTIVPTTVSCERSFSVTKYSIHLNMKGDSIIASVTNKLHENAPTKWF